MKDQNHKTMANVCNENIYTPRNGGFFIVRQDVINNVLHIEYDSRCMKLTQKVNSTFFYFENKDFVFEFNVEKKNIINLNSVYTNAVSLKIALKSNCANLIIKRIEKELINGNTNANK